MAALCAFDFVSMFLRILGIKLGFLNESVCYLLFH